jgi:16S rRNA (cytosine1402-N4)-methyltransferase
MVAFFYPAASSSSGIAFNSWATALASLLVNGIFPRATTSFLPPIHYKCKHLHTCLSISRWDSSKYPTVAVGTATATATSHFESIRPNHTMYLGMSTVELRGEEEGTTHNDVTKCTVSSLTTSSTTSFYNTDYHAPVMVTECIEALLSCHRGTHRRGTMEDSRQNPLLFIDATLGGGGHTQALLDQLQYGDIVFGVDVDAEALQTASLRLVNYLPVSHPLSTTKHERHLPTFIPIQSNFKDLGHIIPTIIQQYCNATTNIDSTDGTTGAVLVDGILMDLGVSSHQIDESTRGFAILKDGPLDMRMAGANTESSSSFTAADICNEYSEKDLIHIFQQYGDESHQSARRIAKSIMERRPLVQTSDLMKAIAQVTPKFCKASRRKGLSATSARIFQSLRIVVNREDEALKVALTTMAPSLIRPGGHLVVLSYHSMEDRYTKRIMKDGDLTDNRNIRVERDVYGNIINPVRKPWKMLGKGRKATEEEVTRNSRARSATLRVAERST